MAEFFYIERVSDEKVLKHKKGKGGLALFGSISHVINFMTKRSMIRTDYKMRIYR